jgi:hypothetical protein
MYAPNPREQHVRDSPQGRPDGPPALRQAPPGLRTATPPRHLPAPHLARPSFQAAQRVNLRSTDIGASVVPAPGAEDPGALRDQNDEPEGQPPCSAETNSRR